MGPHLPPLSALPCLFFAHPIISQCMAKTTPKAYLDLKELSQKLHTYASILGLLHWDQETYMPPGAIVPRSSQIAELSHLIHEGRTSSLFKKHLEKLVHLNTGKLKAKNLSKYESANLREWHKDFLRATKLPAHFVKEASQLAAEASPIWASAKQTNQFKLFAPYLEKIVAMNRRKAEILGFGDHPYDALIEAYEPCMTTARLRRLFTPLRHKLETLLKKIQQQHPQENPLLAKKVSEKKQLLLGKRLLALLPANPAHTRLDLSSHPFSLALHPHDSRITTRILPRSFMSNIFSILHETGHSLYEMGLQTEHWGTPLGEPVSLSIHESQSRWWETRIGRSLPFCKLFFPMIQKEIPWLNGMTPHAFYRAINHVRPSFTRVEADEVTYCLHVILRFEIEQMLIDGRLQVYDLPEAWNEKMKEIFGIAPRNDREGCLQDIHWSLGDFGYFPTYALGNLFASQFFTAFEKEHKDWESKVEAGELSFLYAWLKEKIHRWGRMYNSDELVKKITGEPLSESAYCNYLNKKYSEI